jgi:tRNA(Ile)-lysidine synthase
MRCIKRLGLKILSLVDLVREKFVSRGTIAPGARVLAACSGGCDSMALLHILYCLKDEMGFYLAAANVDHMLRREAKDEARLVEEFCACLKIPYYHQAVDVPSFMAKNGLSLQEAARQTRYEYLRAVAKELGGAKIATGHHRDDQAETVLINFLRGAGSGGLSGMKDCSGGIIRPLLLVSRASIEEYCAENNITFCHDESNFKTDYLRNAVRLKLIPELEREYNGKIRETLIKTAEIVSVQNDFIAQSAAAVWEGAVDSGNDGKVLRLNIGRFKNFHLAIKREIVRKIIEEKMGKLTGISFTHVESLIKLAMDGRVGAVLTLPHGLAAEKTYESVVFTERTDIFPQKDEFRVYRPLAVDALTQIPELGLLISLELYAKCPEMPADSASAVFDYDFLKPPFFLRNRLPGDYFAPCGSPGGKKLKEFFIDKKVPQKERDSVPLIVDEEGIIWVAGHRRSNRAQITETTKKFLKITIFPS